MKRSEINRIISKAKDFFAQHRFLLPPFAEWTTDNWQEAGPEAAGIVDNQMGWDITDFGSGDFAKEGLVLFTMRNGLPDMAGEPGYRSYAEKIMVVEEAQVTPMHFHFSKTEDIINRGGGNLIIQVYNSTDDEELDNESEVAIQMDGIISIFPAGAEVVVKPGASITIPAHLYHSFRAEPGKGPVMAGEVSEVNDDNRDNRFLKPAGRFPAIDEDEPPLHLLVGDYEKYYFKDNDK